MHLCLFHVLLDSIGRMDYIHRYLDIATEEMLSMRTIRILITVRNVKDIVLHVYISTFKIPQSFMLIELRSCNILLNICIRRLRTCVNID